MNCFIPWDLTEHKILSQWDWLQVLLRHVYSYWNSGIVKIVKVYSSEMHLRTIACELSIIATHSCRKGLHTGGHNLIDIYSNFGIDFHISLCFLFRVIMAKLEVNLSAGIIWLLVLQLNLLTEVKPTTRPGLHKSISNECFVDSFFFIIFFFNLPTEVK